MTMRLIDADALIEALHKAGTVMGQPRFLCRTVYECINNAPTIDAVPVVRCEDCKHYEDDPLGMGFGHCELKEELALAFDRVCADGERKDNE